jgi:hypothetical protein
MSRARSSVGRRDAGAVGAAGAHLLLAGALAASVLVCVCVGALGVGVSSASAPVAVPARTISLNETAHLHLTSKHGFTLNEEGSAVGTIRGKIYLHLKIVSTNRVTAEVSIYPSGGSLTGYAAATYHVAGATASFSGSMSIARGTGRYRHARGSGLGFNGTIKRSTDAVTVYLTGKMSV